MSVLSGMSETLARSLVALEGGATAGERAVLGTGDAARLCAVDPRTIARWIDAGLIRSHRTAGGRRRVRRSDLLAFMQGRGMPLPAPTSDARIAVIDDDVAFVRALMRTLRRVAPGAECREAYDGFSGGALVASFQPHILFLDVVMPGVSGVDVCKHIRANQALAEIAIVIISGELTGDLRARLAAAGANRCIQKPFSRSDLSLALTDFLRADQVSKLSS